MADGRRGGGAVQSVERALDLLEVLAAAPDEMGVTELTEATGLPGATIHRLLATLLSRGYAHQDPVTRRYSLGSRLVRLGGSAGRRFGTWMRPWLVELMELSGETANLAVLEDSHVVYVAQVPSRHKVRMFTEVGNRLLPHTTAVGKVLLAFRPREVTGAVIARNGLPGRTGRTITDAGRLYRELEQVARRGYAVDDEEEEEGVCCIAVPVFGPDDAPAAMSVSGPTSRLGPGRRQRILPRMLRVSADASAALLSAGDPARRGDRHP